jgi:hypothetical protein
MRVCKVPLPWVELVVFPLYSLYTLQSLDVVLFKPWATGCAAELRRPQCQSCRLSPVRKPDYSPLFRSSCHSDFRIPMIRPVLHSMTSNLRLAPPARQTSIIQYHKKRVTVRVLVVSPCPIRELLLLKVRTTLSDWNTDEHPQDTTEKASRQIPQGHGLGVRTPS